MRKKFTLFGFLVLATVLFTGCGKENSELSTFKENINTFCDNIVVINDQINAIDAGSETAADDLLASLDQLDEQFKQLAALEVPDEFANVEELADSASENMTKAVEMYHESYSEDSYNEYVAEAAHEYYSRANSRLKYIIQIIHGEIPEADDITYILEDETSESGAEDIPEGIIPDVGESSNAETTPGTTAETVTE